MYSFSEMVATSPETMPAACLSVEPSGMDTLTVGALVPLSSLPTRTSYGSLMWNVYVPGMKRVA